ncbi:MAG: endonuclease V [Archaeoglobaceae archaeon]|nr:endonuclease V [Archaeoglobaceae archaeon]MDW8117419.1 endonuclease V [Archaeoglobaceae archaeon]
MNIQELKEIQLKIAEKVDLRDRYRIDEIKHVIGVDQTFIEDKILSCAVKFNFPELKEIGRNFSLDEVKFPYIPGYLMFREGDPAVNAVKELISENTIIIVDGSGIAHPRKCGLATYIAVKTETPAVGITKKRLFGEIEGNGDVRAIKDAHRVIGYAIKGCKNCKEIYISPGSFISPETALEIVKICMKGKLPLPIKIAHEFGQELKRAMFFATKR